MSEKQIEIRFTGGPGIMPGKIRSKDLAEVITSIEDSISSMVIKENPNLKKEDIVIGLSGIKNGSLRLAFEPQMESETYTAYYKIIEAIKADDYEGLPGGTMKGLKKIVSFTKKFDCNAEFKADSSDAVITPSTLIEVSKVLKGETTIYGKVLRVGGKEPRVMLELIEGDILFCDIDMRIAKELGKKLYSIVGLTGTAVWHSESLDLEEFEATEINEYKAISITESMAELSLHVGKYFKNIDNVEEYISDLRND